MRTVPWLLLLLLTARVTAQTTLRACPTVDTADSTQASARVEVDTTRAEIRIVAGPYHIAGGMVHHAPNASMDATVLRLAWPVDGWARGYRIALCDGDASSVNDGLLPRAMVHHAGLANFSRRQLLYPTIERLLATGSETADVMLPRGVGIPLHRGDSIGVFAGLHSSSGRAVEHAYLIMTLAWQRSRRTPIEVLPFYVDVNHVIGRTTVFDLPRGRTVRSADFFVPLNGRVLAIGGHLHDYGVAIRLEDAESGKTLARLPAMREADGRIRGVSRFYFGYHEEALRLETGHRYRVVAEYFNPTGSTVISGGMGLMAGIFAPDEMEKWPKIDPRDPDLRIDEASLLHGDMSMP